MIAVLTPPLTLPGVTSRWTTQPNVLNVLIKTSKTDPLRNGITLFVGKISSGLCPVSAMLAYLVIRGPHPGSLFMFNNGLYLTRARFVDAVRGALHEAGIQCMKYSRHSFRIGAATTAEARGIEDSVIKTLGRWKSLAYLEYVRIPRQQLANYSSMLC